MCFSALMNNSSLYFGRQITLPAQEIWTPAVSFSRLFVLLYCLALISLTFLFVCSNDTLQQTAQHCWTRSEKWDALNVPLGSCPGRAASGAPRSADRPRKRRHVTDGESFLLCSVYLFWLFYRNWRLKGHKETFLFISGKYAMNLHLCFKEV